MAMAKDLPTGRACPTGLASLRSRTPDMRLWWQRLLAARWLWMSVTAFALTRVGIALVAYIAEPLIVDSTVPPYHLRPDNVVVDVFGSRWDTGFYLDIAENGYVYHDAALPSVAFFPMLPLLIRAVASFTGDPLIAGLLVTNAALLIAVILLYRLVDAEWGAAVADRAIWYVLIFPTSFFGSAIYSESLFLLAAIGALSAARRGYWESAAMLGLMAGLTRLVGIVVAPMLALEWWRQHRAGDGTRHPPLWGLLAAAAAPLGTAAYMLYLDRTFGDPLAFARASAAWGRVPQSPLVSIVQLVQPPVEGWSAALLAGRLPLDNWIDFVSVVLFLALGIALLAQRRWGEGIFVTLGTLIPFSSGLLMSQRRYVWVLFPAFVLLARWGGKSWFDRAVTVISLLGLGLFTALFANWYWVG